MSDISALFQLDRLDRQLITLHALGRPLADRAWLVANDLDAPPGVAGLPIEVQTRLAALAERRLKGEPVAYLVGEKEFFGLSFEVTPAVLVPRPETEELVSCGLQALLGLEAAWIQAEGLLGQGPRVLDLGTGSGAIAVALAVQARQRGKPVQVHASDLSADALAVAWRNAARHGVAIDLRQGAWFEPWAGAHDGPRRFDLILSNPPYVAAGDAHLAALRHEPMLALVGDGRRNGAPGSDGLGDIRHIVAQAPEHLRPGGWLALEHGHTQGAAVRALLRQAGLENVQSLADTAGLERVSHGQMHDKVHTSV